MRSARWLFVLAFRGQGNVLRLGMAGNPTPCWMEGLVRITCLYVEAVCRKMSF